MERREREGLGSRNDTGQMRWNRVELRDEQKEVDSDVVIIEKEHENEMNHRPKN